MTDGTMDHMWEIANEQKMPVGLLAHTFLPKVGELADALRINQSLTSLDARCALTDKAKVKGGAVLQEAVAGRRPFALTL